MKHVTFKWGVSHLNEAFHSLMKHVTYKWGMSHINEACYISMKHVPIEWSMSHSYETELISFVATMYHTYWLFYVERGQIWSIWGYLFRASAFLVATMHHTYWLFYVQPVPEKMRLEMVIGMQTKILDGHSRSLFERLIWKELWALTIEDFDLRFDEHFESHLLGSGCITRSGCVFECILHIGFSMSHTECIIHIGFSMSHT